MPSAVRTSRAVLASLWIAAGPWIAGCTPPGPAAAPSATRPAASGAAPPPRAPTRVAFTPRETQLAEELEHDVNELAVSIGERNPGRKWEFASASDYLAGELEGAGYTLDRQGYEVDGVTAQNLGVEITGSKLPDEIVVVGAHYDSASGSPGANDATGSAAILALARQFRSTHPERSVRFVVFGTGRAPYYGTEQMGSLVYAKRSRVRGEKLAGVIGVGSIGCYSDAPRSQRTPGGDPDAFSDVGDFVAVFGDTTSKSLANRVVSTFMQQVPFTARPAALGSTDPDHGESTAQDAWAFWRVGYQAVSMSDTGPLRYAHDHAREDTPNHLNFRRMARVVVGISGVIADLAGMAATK